MYQNGSTKVVVNLLRKAVVNYTEISTEYVYDYFIKDHLGNVRAIITEESLHDIHMASMELPYANDEETQFYNIPDTREDKPPTMPADSTTTPDDKVSLLNAAEGNPVGHSKVLAMSEGDTVSFDTKYFYQSTSSVTGSTRPLEDILGQLMNIFIAGLGNGISGEQQTIIQNSFTNNPNLNSFLVTVVDTADTTGLPRAYLTWLFFNREFEFIPEASGLLRADQPDQLSNLAMLNLVAPENGYLFVYVSNESNMDVSFDNLRVIYIYGWLMEQSHYYPYGLLIESLSNNRTFWGPDNRYKYNTKEWEKDMNLNLYDYGARMQDPQLGRWHMVDPMSEKSRRWSPYNYALDNPVRFIDPDGMMIRDTWAEQGNKSAYEERLEAEESSGDEQPTQGVDENGNVVYDDGNTAKDGDVYLVNSGYNQTITSLPQLQANSVQVMNNFQQVGPLDKRKTYIEGQMKQVGINIADFKSIDFIGFKSTDSGFETRASGIINSADGSVLQVPFDRGSFSLLIFNTPHELGEVYSLRCALANEKYGYDKALSIPKSGIRYSSKLEFDIALSTEEVNSNKYAMTRPGFDNLPNETRSRQLGNLNSNQIKLDRLLRLRR